MNIKNEKTIMKLVNEENINNRFDIGLDFLVTHNHRSKIMELNIDKEMDKLSKEELNERKNRSYSLFRRELLTENKLRIFNRESNILIEKDLSFATDARVNIEFVRYRSKLFDIIYDLVFSFDKNMRLAIYNELPYSKFFKKSKKRAIK